MPHFVRAGAILAAAMLLVSSLTACSASFSIGGGDGTIKFGTGLDSDHHATGQKSAFSVGDKLYYDASLKDTVKGNTIKLKIAGPKGQTLENDFVTKSTDDADHVWAGPLNLADFKSAGGLGKYTFTMSSKGNQEAKGSFTLQ